MERFFSPSKGKILLDGIELSDIPLEEYRDSIGFIGQSASLISGTVEDNLRLQNSQLLALTWRMPLILLD